MNVYEYLEFPRGSKFLYFHFICWPTGGTAAVSPPRDKKDSVSVTQVWRPFESGDVLEGTTPAAPQATLSQRSASRNPG